MVVTTKTVKTVKTVKTLKVLLLLSVTLALLSTIHAVPKVIDLNIWEKCADYGEVCKIERTKMVALGYDDTIDDVYDENLPDLLDSNVSTNWIYNEFSHRVRCTPTGFGYPDDSFYTAHDVKKVSCYIKKTSHTWKLCSYEVGSADTYLCEFNGTSIVRYGSIAGGGFLGFTVATDSFKCTNSNFLDFVFPGQSGYIDGQYKRCYVMVEDPWVRCNSDGHGYCRFDGYAFVRYGYKGVFSIVFAKNEVKCNSETFDDPYPDTQKVCDVRYGGSNFEWETCAAEGSDCTPTTRSIVRKGSSITGDYKYLEIAAGQTVGCIWENFGFTEDPHPDPYPYISEPCEYADFHDYFSHLS